MIVAGDVRVGVSEKQLAIAQTVSLFLLYDSYQSERRLTRIVNYMRAKFISRLAFSGAVNHPCPDCIGRQAGKAGKF